MLNIENHIRALGERFDLPPESVGDDAQVHLSGSHQLTVEGHRGIRLYDPIRIEIRTTHEIIAVEGEDLQVSFLSSEQISVRGSIRAVTLERAE